MSQEPEVILDAPSDAPAEPVEVEVPEKKKRKSPSRFGPVTSIDLERLEQRAKDLFASFQDTPGYNELIELEKEISGLLLRERIAEASAKNARRKESK